MISKAGFHKLTGALFLTGAAIGLYFLFTYHTFIDNDGLSYINIAKLYAQGDWAHAINGYWSPLYCWILAICDLLSIPLQEARYVINFLAAGSCLFLILQIANRYFTVSLFYYLFALFAVVFLLYFGLITISPDLIGCAFSLWFLLLISDEGFLVNKKLPVMAGIAAACMYFAKSYNFLVLNAFLIGYIFYLLFTKKKQFIKPLLKTYAFFLLVAMVWVAVLSLHEKHFTFATSGRFNYNLVGPHYGSELNPIHRRLYAPPFEQAYCAHVNPANLLDSTYDWSPWENSRNFNHQLTILSKTIRAYYNILDSRRIRTLLLIAAFLLLVMNRKKWTILKHPGLIPLLLFFLVYPVFYFPMVMMDRYVFVCILLFQLFFFYVLSLTWRLLPKKLLIIGSVAAITVIAVPTVITVGKRIADSSAGFRYERSFYHQLDRMVFLRDQRIASDITATIEPVQLCYYFNCRYYCTWSDGQYGSLKQYGIRYLLTKEEQASFPFLLLKEKIPVDNNTLYIYEVKSELK